MKNIRWQKKINRCRQKITAKFCSNAGETIVETLVTMIILSLAVIMLSGAIVTSARVNQRADNSSTAFATENESVQDGTVTISDNGGSAAGTVDLKVKMHTTQNGYIYYEPQ